MSENALLNEMISYWSEIGHASGNSEIVDNTLNQLERTNSFYKQLSSEQEDWEGYTEPYTKIDIDNYIDEVKKMNKGETKVFVIHHPYYRKKIREVAKELGYSCKSSVDSSIEMNEDSELVKHFECNKVTPECKINWMSDYGMMGYVGEYAYCPHCNEKFHTDYKYHPEYNKKKEWMGYMVIQGKNTITVKS
jgi:hypothetical protein